jgi:hypothetical protein
MKKLLFLFIILVRFSNPSHANRINLNTYQWGDKGYYINGQTFPYVPGDTFVLSGNWNYCSMDHVNGTAARHVGVYKQRQLRYDGRL